MVQYFLLVLAARASEVLLQLAKYMLAGTDGQRSCPVVYRQVGEGRLARFSQLILLIRLFLLV